MKEINFLTGLPRSGNTVLSAILNQNPDFYSSPLSPLNEMIWHFHHHAMVTDSYHRNPNPEALGRSIGGIFQSYYADRKEPIIFDRDKFWGTPGNLRIIKKYVNPNPKIIATVRSIPDILASYVSFSDNAFIDKKMIEADFFPLYYQNLEDARCEWLMAPNNDIDKALLSISQALLEENKDNFILIEYEDLINNPQDVMKRIYTFLGYKFFNHNFNNIVKVEKDDERAINHPENIHKIRPKLQKKSKNIDEVLSLKIRQKFSNMEFWR